MPKKSTKKKTVLKTTAKKPVKKTVKPAKKSVKKTIKKTAAKPVAKKVVKKSVTPKKVVKKQAPKAAKSLTITPVATINTKQTNNRSRFTIYFYWIIIIFFVCATFYIVGRGHEFLIKYDNESQYEISDQGLQLLETGKTKLLDGDIQGALIDVSAAIETDPESALAYTYRGEIYMSDANYVAAKADFDKAIKLKSRSSLAFYDRALLKIHMGELESAMSDLNSALKIFGKNPTEVLTERDIYSKRAQLNLWMKNWEAAVSDYDVAISQSLEDSSDQDFAGRADAYTAIGNYEMALQDYTLAIKIISEDIQKDEDQANRINMSRRAMSYFEKSAALRIQIKDIPNARSDLESANALAGALGDIDTQKRITELLIGLNGKYGY